MTVYVTRSYSMNESNFIKAKRKPTINEIYSKNLKFMPPKATWFEPKPLDGLFFYKIIE